MIHNKELNVYLGPEIEDTDIVNIIIKVTDDEGMLAEYKITIGEKEEDPEPHTLN